MQTHVVVLFKCVLMLLFVLLTILWLSSRVALSSRSVSISKRKSRRRNNSGGAKKNYEAWAGSR